MERKDGRFVKGKSGNATGRPKIVGDLRALAQEHGASSIALIVNIRDDKKMSAGIRLAASKELLDRGYGRPPQSVEVSGDMALSLGDLVPGQGILPRVS